MATLGKVVVSLEAEHAAFSKATEDVAKELKKLSEKSQEAAKKSGGLWDSIKQGIGVGIGIGIVTEGFHLLTTTIETSITTLAEWVAQSVEMADQAWDVSNALGITVESLTALGGVDAGVGIEGVSDALKKLQKNLGEAVQNGGTAAKTFERLGLSVEDLANQSLDKTFVQIADKIHNIENPARRATALVELFGKSGQDLYPVFESGAEGIREAMDEAKRIGLALSDIDAGKLHAVKDEAEKLGQVFQGIKNQLAIALSPALISIGQKIRDWIPDAAHFRTVFDSALRVVAAGVGYLWNAFDQGKIIVLDLATEFVALAEVSLVGIDKITKAIDDLNLKLEASKTISDAVWSVVSPLVGLGGDALGAAQGTALSQMAGAASTDWAGQAAKDLDAVRAQLVARSAMAENPKSHVSDVVTYFDTLEKKADALAKKLVSERGPGAALAHSFDEASKKVDDILADMAKDIGTFGQTAAQKKLFDLAAMGASPEALATAKAYGIELERLDKIKKDSEDSKKLTEDVASPIEKYTKALKDANNYWVNNLITDQTYLQAIDKANKDLAGAFQDKHKDTKVGAETRRFDFNLAPPDPEHADGIQGVLQQAKLGVKVQERSERYLAEIERFQREQNKDADVTIDF